MFTKKYFLRFFLIIISVCFFITNSFPQEYYPLEIGNRWDYKRTFCDNGGNCFTDTFSVEIISDSVFTNGNQYYILNEYDLVGGKILRADSSYIIYYDDNETDEDTIFRLDAEVGDSWLVDFGITFIVDLISIDTTSLFSFQTVVYEFKLDGLIQNFIWLSDKFGPKQLYSPGEPPGTSTTSISLLGCILSGVQYGELVSVELEQTNPQNFYLSQNYPNPFNPSTKIKYEIPENGFVSLKVFDVLGKEIATLVQEEKLSGSYEISFNESEIPSGVYFYQLQTGQFIDAKKMVLTK